MTSLCCSFFKNYVPIQNYLFLGWIVLFHTWSFSCCFLLPEWLVTLFIISLWKNYIYLLRACYLFLCEVFLGLNTSKQIWSLSLLIHYCPLYYFYYYAYGMAFQPLIFWSASPNSLTSGSWLRDSMLFFAFPVCCTMPGTKETLSVCLTENRNTERRHHGLAQWEEAF